MLANQSPASGNVAGKGEINGRGAADEVTCTLQEPSLGRMGLVGINSQEHHPSMQPPPCCTHLYRLTLSVPFPPTPLINQSRINSGAAFYLINVKICKYRALFLQSLKQMENTFISIEMSLIKSAASTN